MNKRIRQGFHVVVAAMLLTAAAPVQMKQPWIGNPAPAFNLAALDGKALSLADLKGKLVVLHFGAGW